MGWAAKVATVAAVTLITACDDVDLRLRPHVILIDIDGHGMSALWNANAPHLQQMAHGGVLAYSRVDIPTQANQSTYTLLTAAWPEFNNVPDDSWIDRTSGAPPVVMGSLTA